MTKLVGITGGIGSGKTTLSNHLKKLGYLVHESPLTVSVKDLNFASPPNSPKI